MNTSRDERADGITRDTRSVDIGVEKRWRMPGCKESGGMPAVVAPQARFLPATGKRTKVTSIGWLSAVENFCSMMAAGLSQMCILSVASWAVIKKILSSPP